MEALEVAHRFLTRDTSHRVESMAKGVRSRFARGKLHPNFEGVPSYGVVDDERNVPWATDTPYELRQGKRTYGQWLHFVDHGRYLYFPHLSEGDPVLDVVWRVPGATYHPTPLLLKALWQELREYETPFPEVPGMELVVVEEREKDFKFLTSEGFHIQMGAYAKRDEVLGTNRLLATGFITKFGFPGEEAKVVNRLEVSAELIQRIEEGQPNSRDTVVVDEDVQQFVLGLKDMCYSVQRDHGPFAAKYAWEVYKQTAKFLTSPEKLVS